MKKHIFIGILVFCLLKHNDEIGIKITNPTGGTTLLRGGGRPPIPRSWLRLCLKIPLFGAPDNNEFLCVIL